jgi:hypothetical protein
LGIFTCQGLTQAEKKNILISFNKTRDIYEEERSMGSSGNKSVSTEFASEPAAIREPSLGLLIIFSLIGVSLVMIAMSLGIYLSILG